MLTGFVFQLGSIRFNSTDSESHLAFPSPFLFRGYSARYCENYSERFCEWNYPASLGKCKRHLGNQWMIPTDTTWLAGGCIRWFQGKWERAENRHFELTEEYNILWEKTCKFICAAYFYEIRFVFLWRDSRISQINSHAGEKLSWISQMGGIKISINITKILFRLMRLLVNHNLRLLIRILINCWTEF